MIATHWVSGEPVCEGDIFSYKGSTKEYTVSSFEDFLTQYPEERTSTETSFVPFLSGPNKDEVDGYDVESLTLVATAGPHTNKLTDWDVIIVGDRIRLWKNSEKHEFIVKDFEDTVKHGRILYTETTSFALTDNWRWTVEVKAP